MADAFAVFGITDMYKDPFSLEMLGQKYISLIITGILFFAIIVLLETKIKFCPCFQPNIEKLKALSQTNNEDIDVSQERKRIENNEASQDVLFVKNLTKKYRLVEIFLK